MIKLRLLCLGKTKESIETFISVQGETYDLSHYTALDRNDKLNFTANLMMAKAMAGEF